MLPTDEQELLSGITLDQQVAAIVSATGALFDMAELLVVPELQKVTPKDDFYDAVAGAYYRMLCWMKSLTKLDTRYDLQAASSGNRTMFELSLDVYDLCNDSSLAHRYHDATFYQRFVAADRLIKFCDSKLCGDPRVGPNQRRFIADPTNVSRLQVVSAKYNWTGLLGQWHRNNLATRSEAAGVSFETFYKDVQPRLSWFIHSGGASISGLSSDGFLRGIACAHNSCQEMFVDATRALTSRFQLAIPKLADAINQANMATARCLAEHAVKLWGSETSDCAPE